MIFKKETQASATKPLLTRVRVKFDCGFPNTLYIRGSGGSLSWDRGQPLKNVKPNEWVWESMEPPTPTEFKVLINDRIYEQGLNHPLKKGEEFTYTPQF